MAHKKAGGSSRNGRDSAGQRLGVKLAQIAALAPALEPVNVAFGQSRGRKHRRGELRRASVEIPHTDGVPGLDLIVAYRPAAKRHMLPFGEVDVVKRHAPPTP